MSTKTIKLFQDISDTRFSLNYLTDLIDKTCLPVNVVRADLRNIPYQEQYALMRENYCLSLTHFPNVYFPFVSDIMHMIPAFRRIFRLWKDDCKLKDSCDVLWSPSRSTGNAFPLILVAGINPGAGEYLNTGKWGSFWSAEGPSARLLRQTLENRGLLQHTWFSNVVRCATVQNTFPTDRSFSNCVSKWFRREIDTLHPKHIVLIGKSLDSVADLKHLNVTIIKHPMYFIRKGKESEFSSEFDFISL